MRLPLEMMRRRVADFPRPPAIERETRRITVTLGGVEIGATDKAWAILETTHPPTFYLPVDAFIPGSVERGSARVSYCEWKGVADYLTLVGGARREIDAAWTYREPAAHYVQLRDHVALYPGRVDCCTLGGEIVQPQPGGFYGGWITSDLEGPFKGGPGTTGW